MILKVFFSTFLSRNNLIFQKNATWKADEIVSKPKIVLRKIVSNTERKTWQPEKAGEVYQNQETHGDTRRVDGSEIYKNWEMRFLVKSNIEKTNAKMIYLKVKSQSLSRKSMYCKKVMLTSIERPIFRVVELKKILGGGGRAINYEILSATTVGRKR